MNHYHHILLRNRTHSNQSIPTIRTYSSLEKETKIARVNTTSFFISQKKMKIDTSDVKKGTILNLDDQLYRVTDTSHTHMGRQGATYSFKVKGITTGKTKIVTYNAGTVLEQAEVQTKSAIFLYSAGDDYSFMINDT